MVGQVGITHPNIALVWLVFAVAVAGMGVMDWLYGIDEKMLAAIKRG